CCVTGGTLLVHSQLTEIQQTIISLQACPRIRGSARASRAGDGAPAIANFFLLTHCNIPRRRRIDCGEAPQSAREARALPRVALASRVVASSPSGRGLP